MSPFFSEPQPTIEAAAALHEYGLFNPAGVFDTGNGYVYGLLREMDSPPHKTAQAIKDATGYTLVIYHDALINVWRTYPDNQPARRADGELLYPTPAPVGGAQIE